MANWTYGVAAMCIALLFGGCTTMSVPCRNTCGGETATGFLNRTLVRSNGETRRYVVYVPHDYDPSKPWPLVMFLHGAGERGDGGLAQTDVGIGRSIRFRPHWFPCIVVMPQCPKESPSGERASWVDVIDDIDLALAQTRAEYNIDGSRMYLTGLSMGGYGTWFYGARRTDTYAALMPICGGGNVEDADELARLPIWVFHGLADKLVPPEKSREMVDAVRKAGGTVKHTEYPGIGHNSWDKAYGTAEAIEWLLAQQRHDSD